MRFSIIIPLYNRPDEIGELLESLTHQTCPDFEVIVVEDGSTLDAKSVVESYQNKLNIQYFSKPNEGQGFTRNYGFRHARGDYFIIFDSDCLIPPHYLQTVEKEVTTRQLDAYGGPDAAHPSFTPIQKAISYAMTSLFTTGGIRGRKKHLGPYHPRSFNMGLSRKVYETVGGYKITRMGEDIEYAIRIIEAGFKTGLIEDAFVYHKRRTDWTRFWKQLQFFGRARINIATFFPNELKIVHFFPFAFLVYTGAGVIFSWADIRIAALFLSSHLLYSLLLFADSFIQNKDLKVALLSIPAAYIQLLAYGTGFFQEYWKRMILKKGNDVKEYPN